MFQESGWINEALEPFIKIQLTNGSTINCLVDTGFSETIIVPKAFAEANNLKPGVREFLQAAEDQIFELDTSVADIFWLGDDFSIPIFISEIGDALIGAEMLIDTILEIDYINSTVKITKPD